jgi:hypothetical protein
LPFNLQATLLFYQLTLSQNPTFNPDLPNFLLTVLPWLPLRAFNSQLHATLVQHSLFVMHELSPNLSMFKVPNLP